MNSQVDRCEWEGEYYTCFMLAEGGVVVYSDWSADCDMGDWGGHYTFCTSEIKDVDELYAKIDGMYKAAAMVHSTLEAAAALGISRRAVQRAINAKTLAATRRGRNWFVTTADIEAYRRDHLRRYGRKSKAG